MDPLSIITLAASTTAASYQVSQFLYMFIHSAKSVDESIEALASEINGLRRTLDALTVTFDGDIFKSEKAIAAENSPIWAAVAGSLNDCRRTLEALSAKMAKATGSATSQNFFRQSLRLIKLRSWGEDIQGLRANVNTHANNLQISLQMVNILALSQSPDPAVEQLGQKLDRLSNSLARLQVGGEQELANPKNKTLENVNATRGTGIELRRTAHELLSNAGELLSTGHLNSDSGQYNQSSKALLEDSITDFNRSLYDFGSVDNDLDENIGNSPMFDSDSDEETALEIAEAAFGEACLRYDSELYPEAEAHFREGLRNHPIVRASAMFDLDDMRLKLIRCCIAQEKWQESELMLMMLVRRNDRNRITWKSLEAHQLLAVTFLCQYDFEAALDHCQRALKGRKHMFGKNHNLYRESLKTLALIYQANGDMTTSTIYLRKLPVEHSKFQDIEIIVKQFSGYSTAEHLRMSLKEKQSAIEQLSSSDLIDRPGSQPNSAFRVGSDSLNFGAALIWAAREGQELTARWLLARGADPQSSVSGDTALMVACSKGNEAVARTLLKSGAEVNVGDRSERTALLWAALWGHESTVHLLLKHGVDVDRPDSDGYTPLLDTAQKGHASIAKLLLSHGANIEAATRKNKTALLLAADNNHIDVARVLLEHGANVDAADHEGKSPLLLAAASRNEPLIRLLVTGGADVKARSSDGSASLHFLIPGCKDGTLRFMLENGAEVDPINKAGETPLLKAAEWGRASSLRELLKWGADPHHELHGRNAMQTAQLRHSTECIEILKDFGISEE